jgi:hypothetical protein
MDLKKQQLLFEYLISSVDTFALCKPIIKSEYFDSDLRESVRFIKNYYDEYHTTPDTNQIFAETGHKSQKRLITKDKIEYCATEIEKFCKMKAYENAIRKSVKVYQEGKLDKIEPLFKEAVTVSLHRNMGINLFENPEEVLRRLLTSEIREPTGWTEFDNALFGGPARKQMILFSANSGEGKSVTLANLAVNYAERGKNCLVLTLELSEEMNYERMIQMVAGVGTLEWPDKIEEVSEKVMRIGEKSGQIHIKRMPQGSNANDFRAYLKEFELLYGYAPDIIIVDYIDLASPNEKKDEGVFEKDKRTSEEIREIGNDYNAIIATASQLNREAVKASHKDHSHIAGGKSKINTTDVYVVIEQTPMMRAKSEIQFTLQKTRSSDGLNNSIILAYNRKTLRITNPAGISFKKKTPDERNENQNINRDQGNDDLLDFFKSTK